jgi:AraC-like DNA-binding protein
MSILYEERLSDSPYVQTVSRVRAESDCFANIPADGHCYLFVMKQNGKTSLTLGGPITKAFSMPNTAGTEWLGIRFKLGTFMPHLPARSLVDGIVNLPEASCDSFWLHGSTWQVPDLENADTFVDRLARDGVLVREPVVEAALQGQLKDLSLRSVQRRFLRATGLTHRAMRHIERARYAVALLEQGTSILDTVYEAGYFDQSHLTRSLKNLMGQTPAQISLLNKAE